LDSPNLRRGPGPGENKYAFSEKKKQGSVTKIERGKGRINVQTRRGFIFSLRE